MFEKEINKFSVTSPKPHPFLELQRYLFKEKPEKYHLLHPCVPRSGLTVHPLAVVIETGPPIEHFGFSGEHFGLGVT